MLQRSGNAWRLIGRQREAAVVDRALANAQAGESSVLVVHGDPGVGKTALLDYAVEAAEGFHVVRASGVEGEAHLDYAALQVLCSPILEFAKRLPGPQCEALAVAFGTSAGHAPSPLLVGLATLGLMWEAADQQPLLFAVDDAHWLDEASATALAFVARRLLAEPIALIFATREVGSDFGRFPSLLVGPLGSRDALALLESVLPARLDQSVLERMVAETAGNPLALVELPRGLTYDQLAGGFGLPGALSLSARIEQSFLRRLAVLPRDAQRLLLVAAAEPLGDPALLWNAARRLGISEKAGETVESEGLLTLDGTVSFRHPLVRSAVYASADPSERREVHRALAEATDPEVAPDRRAWHRSQAALMPDEEVATDLERCAAAAQARGGFAAAAAFLERSVALTIEPAHRSDRALRAAEAKRVAGALNSALRLAAIAESGPLDEVQRAQLDVLRGRVAFAGNRGNDAAPLMLKAASRLEHVDIRLARETYLDALTAALFAGRLALEASAQVVARAALAAPRADGAARASELLLEGLALLITGSYRSGTAALQQAMIAFRSDDLPAHELLRWGWVAGSSAGVMWDYDSWDSLTARQEQLARELGALTILPFTLSIRAGICLYAGKAAEAAFLVGQAQDVTAASENLRFRNASLLVAVFRGEEREARELIDAIKKDSAERGEGGALSVASCATALLSNVLGQYEEAYSAAMDALKDPNDFVYSGWATVELIEAASRVGKAEKAKPALERLIERTEASGTDWALATQARSRALLCGTEEAEALYLEAIERLIPTRVQFELARTRLLYGEWLRRQRRQRDARDQLRRAHELFLEFGMMGFADRAGAELRATGEPVQRREVDSRLGLTPQEARIATLAAQGSTNQAIAEQMFISAATVEYHLWKVYRKLGIKSRTQIANKLLHPDRRTRTAGF
ncbi:MAG TPA: AAA family ATPase [Acidimicrobiales bacterium]|nr:AAA family ATPase [Acidimicrobiales bacterium]